MSKTSSNFRVSCFRNRMLAWIMLTLLGVSLLPSISLAQQPTVRIRTLSGNVLVSGQAATVGTVLQAGDTIQTQAGASVVLELSDGSEIHLGEKTQINIDELTQTVIGARVSGVKLLWGRIRAFLSPQHQIQGSSFDIETPNALIGVKFSEPDIEVSYNLEKAETVGIAHTVELLAKNLVTDEETIIPVGSMAIITALGIKVMAGTATAGAISTGTAGTGATGTGTASTATAGTGVTSTEATGIGTGTMVALGVGAAAAAGGVTAVAASSGDGESSSFSFTGTFMAQWSEENHGGEKWSLTSFYYLTQEGNSITGTEEFTLEACCSWVENLTITGTVVDERSASFTSTIVSGTSCTCSDGRVFAWYQAPSLVWNFTGILLDNGNLQKDDGNRIQIYIRQ